MTQNFTHQNVPYDITVTTETISGLGGVVQHSKKISVGVNGRHDGLFDSGCSASADLDTKINQVREKIERWIDARLKAGRAMPS